MLLLNNHDGAKRQRIAWCLVLIVVAIAGLSCSLVTRTFRLTTSNGITVHSGEAQGMRQHLDRDAVRWVPPVPTLVGLQAPTFYPRIAPAGPPVPGLVLEEPLYNRPPPSLS
jgi:hypothetical protein